MLGIIHSKWYPEKQLTETRPWPLKDDCSNRVNLESRNGT
jgi:hypothetical protein